MRRSMAMLLSGIALALIIGIFLWVSSPRDCGNSIASDTSRLFNINPSESTSSNQVRAEDQSVDTSRHLIQGAVNDQVLSPVTALPSPLCGRVQDEYGGAISNIPVWIDEIPPSDRKHQPDIRTDALGCFTLPALCNASSTNVLAEDEVYATILPGQVSQFEQEQEALVIVAPKNTYAGRVRDEFGNTQGNTHVGVYLRSSFLRSLRLGHARAREVWWETTTDADGVFELSGAGWTSGSYLFVRSDGFLDEAVDLPSFSVLDLEIVLRRPASDESAILGRVLTPDLNPISGAWVFFDGQSTRTDGSGCFMIQPTEASDGHSLVAVMAGFLPVQRTIESSAREDRTSRIELVLGSQPLSICGRVVDSAGDPCRNCPVWTWDGSSFGALRVENISGAVSYGPRAVEVLMAGDPEGRNIGRSVISDDNGNFVLFGLMPTTYTLHAMDPTALVTNVPLAIEAGSTSALLMLDSMEGTVAIAGRVLSSDLIPMPDISVYPVRSILDVTTGLFRDVPRAESVKTDTDGKFAFSRLCIEDARLALFGDRIVPGEFYLSDNSDLTHIEIVVGQPCTLQVIVDKAIEADRFSLLGADGKSLLLFARWGAESIGSFSMDLSEGISEVVEVDSRAQWLVLTSSGDEVLRTPVSLRAGTLQVIRL